jgi:hypothetical protein
MEIIATDDDCPCHLGRHNSSSENTATDRNVAGERALFVYISKIPIGFNEIKSPMVQDYAPM